MKKGGAIFGLLVMSILLISVSFVSANFLGDFWNKITGKVAEENETDTATENETEATNETGTEEPEPEPETCPASISISFDKSNYVVGEQFETKMGVFDSQGNPIPNYPFYVKMYDDRWHTPGQEKTGADGYVKRTGTIENLPGGITRVTFNAYTEETSSCSKVEDTTEVEIEPGSEPEPMPESRPETEPRSEPETCAAEIKIDFGKQPYYVGDHFKIIIEVFDSLGNRLPYYPFYFQTYTYEPEGMWHTPEEQKTDGSGYFIGEGIVEKSKMAVGKTKHKIYTLNTGDYANCNLVEYITEAEIIEKSKPVPCGMGKCIPIEEEEPEEIPEDKILYKCNGCELEGKCYPMGYRKEGKYCSDDYEFVSQIGGKCDNSFECKSNVCISGECIEQGLMKKILKWFKKMFGGEDEESEEPGLEMCSKLLIEKDIGDNEYIKSEYGADEHTQVPVHSKDGENIGTVKCCAADYSTGMVIVCPFDSKEDVRNSLRWILGGGETGTYNLEEYKGERVIDISDGGILVWTNKVYLIASGGKPGAGNKFVEDIADAYFKRYHSDFNLTEDDLICTSDKDMLVEECHFIDDFESGLGKWDFSSAEAGSIATVNDNKVLRLVGVERANIHRIWDNYLFKFRYKMVEGNVHVDFRRNEIPDYGAKRYVVSINGQKVSNLNREINQDFQKLEEIDLNLDNNWHTLEIRCYGDIINVYVDNELVAKHKDTISPLLSGWVRFEAHTGGVPGVVPELLVDDVEIKLITEDDIVYP